MELHRYKSEKILVRWKRSDLVDEKKNWGQFADLWILHNKGYDEGYIENAALWYNPTLKSMSDLEKLFEVMGLVIVKSISTFPPFYVLSQN